MSPAGVDTLIGPRFFRPSPPPPGLGRDELRRPAGGLGSLSPEPAAGPLVGAAARSWPRRATCDLLIAHPRVPLLFNACILPPAHAGTCLPAPRKGR